MKCFYHPGYYYALPEGHPFPMEKFPQAAEELAARSEVECVLTTPAPISSLERIHHPNYLRNLQTGNLSQDAKARLGLPVRPELLQRCQLEVGGTLAAMHTAREEGVAANLAGGTHHAFADRGMGYCVLNDVAIAAQELWQLEPQARVMVIDTDAHQGNGTHALLTGEARAFTYSIHVGANYPSVKVPGTLDVPLPRWADASTYLSALESSLPAAITQFRPDWIFWVSGVDPHEQDRFGQMRLKDEDLAQRDRWVAQWALASGSKLVLLFGGGYHRQRTRTAQLHVQTVLLTAQIFR